MPLNVNQAFGVYTQKRTHTDKAVKATAGPQLGKLASLLFCLVADADKNTLNLCCPQPTRPASSQTQQKKNTNSKTKQWSCRSLSSVTAYARMEVGTELST